MIESGKGDGRNHRGAQVAQEQEDDENGQDGTFDERRHRRMVDADGMDDGGVDQFQLYCGVSGFKLLDLFIDSIFDNDVAGALGAGDGKADNGALVEFGVATGLGDGVGDCAKRIEANGAVGGQGNDGAGKGLDSGLSGQGANRLFASAYFAAPASQINVGGAKLAIDITRGNAKGQ